MADQKKNEYAGMLTEQLFWKATGERALSGAYLLFGEEDMGPWADFKYYADEIREKYLRTKLTED